MIEQYTPTKHINTKFLYQLSRWMRRMRKEKSLIVNVEKKHCGFAKLLSLNGEEKKYISRSERTKLFE